MIKYYSLIVIVSSSDSLKGGYAYKMKPSYMKSWPFRSISASIKQYKIIKIFRGKRIKEKMSLSESLLLTEVTRKLKMLLTERDNFTVPEVTSDCWDYIPHCWKKHF